MIQSTELSIGLGILFGLLYAGASLVTHRFARRHVRRFYEIALGGLLVRLVFCLLGVLLVLVLVPVRPIAFIGAFFVVFMGGLVFEVARLHRDASLR